MAKMWNNKVRKVLYQQFIDLIIRVSRCIFRGFNRVDGLCSLKTFFLYCDNLQTVSTSSLHVLIYNSFVCKESNHRNFLWFYLLCIVLFFQLWCFSHMENVSDDLVSETDMLDEDTTCHHRLLKLNVCHKLWLNSQ